MKVRYSQKTGTQDEDKIQPRERQNADKIAIRERCRQDTDKEPLGKDAEKTQTKSL